MSQSDSKTGSVVLAAGRGTRMYSDQPKVLQRLLDEPMLGYVLRALEGLGWASRPISVIGHGAEAVRKTMGETACDFAIQTELTGTAKALLAAWPKVLEAGFEYLLVVNGDTPLIETAQLEDFVNETRQAGADLAFLSLELENPGAFGRVLREGGPQKDPKKRGKVLGIVEAKDYKEELHGPEPKEINAGIYFLNVAKIGPLLEKITPSPKSGEYYITDLIELSVKAGLKVAAFCQGDDPRLLGINSPRELVEAEELLRQGIVDGWLDKGVLVHNPSQMRIGPLVMLEAGAILHGPGEIYGQSAIKRGVELESHSWLRNAQIAGGTKLRSFCHIEDAVIGEGCQVGPWSRLRPGAVLEDEAHIGNFVEMKKARLGKGAKANHLTYLGDAEVGPGANIGAGTITCNYDGKNKFKTVIGARAFIGSNSALVAPVNIGDNALVGAGSVITKDVPENALSIARGRQSNMEKKPK